MSRIATVHLNLLRRPKLFRPLRFERSALSTFLHRLRATAEWKSVTTAT